MLSAYTRADIKAHHEEEVMKKFCFFAVSILYLCLGTTSKAEMQYLGEFCIKLTPITSGGPETLQLGLLSYGSSDTFPLYGKRSTVVGSDTILVPMRGKRDSGRGVGRT